MVEELPSEIRFPKRKMPKFRGDEDKEEGVIKNWLDR